MIHITRTAAPSILTAHFVSQATAKYISDGSSVWNIDEVKSALSEMSGHKCAYCEVMLGEGTAYLEVEHFHAKHHHPNMVLQWNNLLPTCRRCNGKKGSWDVAVPGQEMVDPCSDSPNQHIRLDPAYRPIGLTTKGKNTIIEIDLDDIQRLGVVRFRLGETFKRKIEELYRDYSCLHQHSGTRQRRAIVRKVKSALEKCGPDQPFSAVTSTVLMRSAEYASLKAAMVTAGDWDPELTTKDAAAAAASLA